MPVLTTPATNVPFYGGHYTDEQHCFDCDMVISKTGCTEPLCSEASSSLSTLTASLPNLSSNPGSSGTDSADLTCHCTAGCIVVACDDPDHAEPICNEQGPHSVNCDLGCDADIDCHACHRFDDFLQCCDNYLPFHPGTLTQPLNSSQNSKISQRHVPPSPTQSFSWDPAFNDFQAWCGCPPKHSGKLPGAQGVQVQDYGSINRNSQNPTDPNAHQPSPSFTPGAVNMNGLPYSSQHSPGNASPFSLAAYPSRKITSSSAPDPHDSPTTMIQPLSCLWGNCHASFSTLADLVAHVNVQHLVTSQSPDIALEDNSRLHVQGAAVPTERSAHGIFQSSDPSDFATTTDVRSDSTYVPCQWANCTTEGVISFDGLAYHLLHEHLGVQSTCSSFNPNERTVQHNNQPLDTLSASSETFSTFEPTAISAVTKDQLDALADQCMETFAAYSPTTTVVSSGSPIHVTSDESYTCGDSQYGCKWARCGTCFHSCDDLTTHITTEHIGSGKAKYECFWEGCNRNGSHGFMSKQKICRHVQSHTGHRPFQCDICHQHFSEAATLQQHIRRHTQEKPYVCDYPGCGKSFAITGALTIHKRTHNGDKPFKCTYCQRAFAESSNLSKHLRTHTGARPYPCPEPGCGKAFARPDQLNRHKNVHQRQARGSTTPN